MKRLFTLLLLLSATFATRAAADSPALILDSHTAGSLQERIEASVKGDPGAIESLIIRSGRITAADCAYIKSTLHGLKRLVIEQKADFAGSTIPKGAFAGCTSIEYIRAENVKSVGAKAFASCESLVEADFPDVTTVEVQAFAQSKGSSTSRLQCVRLPRLAEMAPRTFYYCTNLKELYLAKPPKPQRPEGKEGLWFERVTEMVIHVPSRAVYDSFMAAENSTDIDWSAFNFTADNGDSLPAIERAEEFDNAAYDHLRNGWLKTAFDRTNKDFSGEYYTGDFKLSLNLYTFNMNLNAWMNGSQSAPQLSTLDAIRWAADNGFEAVDVTCYYIPGYSNTSMPTKSEKEILDYARQIRKLCSKSGVEISGTGLQNNFADPNPKRRETDVERIKFWIKVAAEMGAPVIRIFAGPPPADIYREGWEKIARERMVPHIQEVARFAKENYPQVRIGLQNHGGMLATANQVMQVLQWIDCDNVGIVNDTGFYRDFLSTDARNYDWYRDIALILPYSNNFQIKKKPAGAETDIPMDLERLLRDIRKSPYRGYLPIELLWVSKDAGYPGKLETPPYEETRQFIERIREAIEKTKTPPTSGPIATDTRHDVVPGISGSEVRLFENSVAAQIAESGLFPEGARIRAAAATGMPRNELEPLQNGDRIEVATDSGRQVYTVAVKRWELTNLALDPDPSRIKKSSYRGRTPVTNAFDGNAVGTSGTGYTVDASQAAAAGKETFWLAVDLGSEQRIDAFGVAWGTSVGQLRKRLKGGIYRIAYTCDEQKWSALSDAAVSGKGGLDNYSAPEGWEVAYVQDTGELPDANGNKFFFRETEGPLTARYAMITGELAESTIEIYNFFVFKRSLVDGAAPRKQYPTFDAALIRPSCEGMVLAVGRPAIVKRGTEVPSYVIEAHENLTLTARLASPDGDCIWTSEPLHIQKDATTVMTPDAKASAAGTYKMNFTLQTDSELLHDAGYFTAVDEDSERYSFTKSYPAVRFDGGRIAYTPDYRGNTLPDYSHAGYGGGGVALPNVPVKIVLEPAGDGSDDAERIQRAVDMIGRSTPDAGGFRGALLLKAGTYRISRPIEIRRGGVVVRGEGDGHDAIATHAQPLSPDNWFDYSQSEQPEKGVTKVVATWVADSYNKNTALFNISGGDAPSSGDEAAITDLYVPVGARTIHVAGAERFKAGDNVRIRRAVGAAWAQDLAMDRITDAPGIASENQWVTKGKLERAYTDVCQERTVAAVDPEAGTITLAEPVIDPLDRKYGVSAVVKFDTSKRVAKAGVENMQLISRFSKNSTASNSAFGVTYKYFDDENHAQVGVRIGNAEDVWVRRITTFHTDIATAVAGGVRRVTVQDVNCLEPVSGTGGERRYSFTNAGGSQVLLQRCYARYTRHGFIVMGNVMGPNVFLNCRTDYQFDANEPHLRWSTGGLYDNVKGRIYVQNRWNNGTAHGWAGANYTLYNCEGKFIISQNMLAANFLLGQSDSADRLPFVMDEADPGNVPNYTAHEYSLGKRMKPESLYAQQLSERMGKHAAEAAAEDKMSAVKDESKGFLERFAYLSSITADGKPLAGFSRDILEYEIPVALDFTRLPEVMASAEKGVKVERTERGKSIVFTASKPKGESTAYTVRFSEVSKEAISCSDGNSQIANLTDGNAHTSWSRSGSPYVQFYLGDTPAAIESVSLGYCRNTQSRRQYYFDFEVSDDGYNWTKVENPQWTPDNLGRGHIMGMQLMPGVGNNPDDYETFRFPEGIKARLLRVRMYGARFGRGSGTTNANSYWSVNVKTK